MLMAIIAVIALLLPYLAGYIAIGIVAGPILLTLSAREYGVEIDRLRDTPLAIIGWIALVPMVILGPAL